MGTFPTRRHKAAIVVLVILGMLGNFGQAIAGGFAYTIGFLIGLTATSTLVVFFVSIIITKLAEWTTPNPDA